MAVDWLSSNLYYTEGALGRIMVSRLQGRYSSILCEGIGAPGALTLDPAEGYGTDTYRFQSIYGFIFIIAITPVEL